MLKGDKRTCDVCEAAILKEQIYSQSTIPPEKAPVARGLLNRKGHSFTENPDGSIALDVCLNCKLPSSLGSE